MSAEIIPLPRGSAVKVDVLKKAVKELEAAFVRKTDAAESFSAVTKHIALQANIDPGVLRKWIAARVQDKEAAFDAQTRQQQLLLDETWPT